jgi:hypothetical protein
VGGVAPLHQQGEIKSRRTAAYAHNLHGKNPILKNRLKRRMGFTLVVNYLQVN